MYQEWLNKNVDRQLFLIEEIYHYISLQQADIKATEIEAVLEKRLEEYPASAQEDRDSWQHTLELIDGAIEHDEEFIRLIGEESVQQLTRPVKRRIKQLAERQ
jgi:hypothetical protein